MRNRLRRLQRLLPTRRSSAVVAILIAALATLGLFSLAVTQQEERDREAASRARGTRAGARLLASCVSPEERAAVEVRGTPGAVIAFGVTYPDGQVQSSSSQRIIEESGRAILRWRIPAAAPEGEAYVLIVVAEGEKTQELRRDFQISNACPK